MELTRRDALAVLTAGGIGAGLATTHPDELTAATDQSNPQAPATEPTFTRHERRTYTATAHVIYPTIITGIDSFVATYLTGRTDPDFITGAASAITLLDDHTEEWYGTPFAGLNRKRRNTALRELGVATAPPNSTGSPASKVRYYLVNELLYALYTSPTGAALVGLENPQGHPGGTESYQRGPPS